MSINKFYNKFFALRLFLSGESPTKQNRRTLFSNYFLVGFREKYIIVRLKSIFETSRKLFIFCYLSSVKNLQFWLMCWNHNYWRLARWLSATACLPFLFSTSEDGLLLFWKGRYFFLDDLYFMPRIFKFLGVEAAILVSPPSNFNKTSADFLPFLGSGVLSVALATSTSMLDVYTYKFYCSHVDYLLFIFYSRLISLFLQRRFWLL